MNQRNEKGQFARGMTPWNKGMKGLNNGGEKGWFKKGQKPATVRPIGSERVDKDGIIQIKANETKWMSKHKYIWESENGPVPNGHVVIFANGDKRDFSLDNLVCVSRRQLVMINKNKLITKDEELTKTGVLLTELLLTIKDRDVDV